MHSQFTPVAITLLAAAAAAQTTNTLPSSAATTSPGSFSSSVFYGTATVKESRTQVLYAATDVQNSGVFKSLQFRRPSNLGNTNVVSTFNLQIDMSMSPVVHTAASATYASNHGTVTTVFNAPINLPANSSGTWPRPWEAPFVFTTPFVFVVQAATSLCVEFQSTLNSTSQPWYVEAATAITGGGTFNSNTSGSLCPHSGAASNNSIGYTAPTIGGNWGPVTWYNLPENNPNWNINAVLIGAVGSGGSFGPFTLPVQLSLLGLSPSSPTCVLGNDILLTQSLTYTTSATLNGGTLRMAAIPVPNNPAIAGVNVFTQPLAYDAPNFWTGWSGRWTIGDGIRRGSPLTQVSRTGANATPTGTIATFVGPTILVTL